MQDEDISLTGHIIGGMFVLAVIVLGGLFARAAWLYPLHAAVIGLMAVSLYLFHRWRRPSIACDELATSTEDIPCRKTRD